MVSSKSLDKLSLLTVRFYVLTTLFSLAYAELYLTTYAIARRFDWEMYETGLNDVVFKHDFLIPFADLKSKGIRATLSRRKTGS